MRTRVRLVLPAAAAVLLVGCLPASSGPSIPPIPRATGVAAAPPSPPAKAQAHGPSKKFNVRTPSRTQSTARARPPEDL